jgi:tetratricopeptide (TPR) repeat protein
MQPHHLLRLQNWVAQQQFSQAEHWLQQQQNSLSDENVIVSLFVQYATLLAEQDLHPQATEILKSALNDFADNIILLRQLSELAIVQGHTLPAIMFLKQALQKDNTNSTLWVQLSSACLHYFPDEARDAAIQAGRFSQLLTEKEGNSSLMIQALQNQAKKALAMVENQDQNYTQAEQLFTEILTGMPYFVPALQGFGQQQMQQGNIDAALTLFEKMKAVNVVQGHLSLINARCFPEDLSVLEKLEQAAHSPSLEGSVRTGILFQLISVWEKRQQYSKAFAFAMQANTACQRLLSYDSTAHRNYCARIQMSFCSALYNHRLNYGIDSTVPVFIVGMPRSGTTLIEQILAGHSQIFGAGELGIIPNIIQGLNRWERHVGSGREYPDCVDDLTLAVTQELAHNILSEIQAYAPKAKHIIDKLPHNFENIGLIKFLFPQAKIISVRRDSRDIAISNFFTDYQAKHGGMGFAYDLTHIGEQLADHHKMMHHWHQVFPQQILEIHYEQVVDDLEQSARQLLHYINVPWEKSVLQFNDLKRPIQTASVWQVRQPVYKTSKARWQPYQQFLSPLFAGTNAPIITPAIQMITLPEAGFLTEGVRLFHQQKLDQAELNFKKMLYHNPHHGACHYMLGLVYLRKGYLIEGIQKIETALEKVPWQKEWQASLIKAYEAANMTEKTHEIQQKYRSDALIDDLDEDV